ncbi:PAS domain-containing hybrid sensor histidine kinase/response regulator [Novosphingobium profundi]|uniref:hybrid sensor histidine kinase/response regulator n=1 Tax=Novosphingobium profundi TaxID=1774954 RepID=UPI001BDB5326|nr:PAS domain-containing hybrid sensor histidine kinase/response regulator [Novosphingobium profundi]MBT0668954.1 PAS domain-containing hybrid sensor histidine kinase/response regulator [Novosphingobium profundi]
MLSLFLVAAGVEHLDETRRLRPRLRQVAHTLALGVYCTSWTFYGSTGTAVTAGWAFLPIYLGPILLLVFAQRFLRRLSRAVAQERATSVSDFIASRFGHDPVVARLVTLIALLGTIPYLALQLRSIGNALTTVSGSPIAPPAMIVATVLLTLFAILFGARRFELAGRSEGLLFAIGLDSAIKIAALGIVALLAVVLLADAQAASVDRGLTSLREIFSANRLTFDVPVILLVSTFAIIALPRQFYMGFVEARGEEDMNRARFGLVLYLAAMAVMIVPIALAGQALLPIGTPPDLYVLRLPDWAGSNIALAAALLGGIGAAASMAIVDTTALATMVSNDLLARAVIGSQAALGAGQIGRRMLVLRRLSIAGIMMLALAFALLVDQDRSLASMGLVAFAAMAQFTPHLLLAVQGRDRDPFAARASLTIGLVAWAYCLALPPILPPGWLELLHDTLLDPERLFGIGHASPFVHGVLWSLTLNIGVHALAAARKMPAPALPRLFAASRRVSNRGELEQFVASFIGEERALGVFPEAEHGLAVDRSTAHRAQALIAEVVGASSARTLVASALASGQMDIADVTRLLDEGGQSLRFSRQLLAATFENIDAGISVVDAELNLIAWNSRYEDILKYPTGMLHAGMPIETLIRHNAERGDFGTDDVEAAILRRLDHLRARQQHSFERRRDDGRVVKTVGGPMPGGGYVMSFTDVTEEVRVRDELERTLAEMEGRVEDRTRELREANRLLARATQDKTRFLAAASHDLLQPLHAARLFTAALGRKTSADAQPLVTRVDNAIVAAEELLRALLDISRIDAGGVTPDPEPVALAPFLTDLAESFRPSAESKGLRLKIGSLLGQVETDPGLLRSVMQNFLSNAIRYTRHGGVVVGVRRRGDWLRIDVVDTGVGFSPEESQAIFGEFTRLGAVEAEGLGLGLALVERIVRLLGGRLEVFSNQGRGSRFSLLLPRAGELPAVAMHEDGPATPHAACRRLAVLVVDNDRRIVDATVALVEQLGHRARGVRNVAQALACAGEVDVVLADYRLDAGETGTGLIVALRTLRPGLPAAILTAEPNGEVRERAEALGVPIFAKPVAPDLIETFLATVSVAQVQPE